MIFSDAYQATLLRPGTGLWCDQAEVHGPSPPRQRSPQQIGRLIVASSSVCRSAF